MENWFTYHSPKGDQTERYGELRSRARLFAQCIVDNTPDGPDQEAAVRKVREAVMTANQAIACEVDE